MSEQRKRKATDPYENKTTTSAYKSKTDPPDYFAMVYFDGREADEVIIEDGIEYERTDKIPFDFASLPEHVKDDLAKAALEAFLEFKKQPGAQAILDTEIERLRREGSTLLDPRPKKK